MPIEYRGYGTRHRRREQGTGDVARGYSKGSWVMQGQYRMIAGLVHVKYKGSTGHTVATQCMWYRQ